MMKTVNTSALIGAALDWAVAKCEGYDKKSALKADKRRVLIPHPDGGGQLFRASTDWAQGGPIIEREAITVSQGSPVKGLEWMACDRGSTSIQHGPTYLIAAMRCHVASKLGDKVEIPEGLSND